MGTKVRKPCSNSSRCALGISLPLDSSGVFSLKENLRIFTNGKILLWFVRGLFVSLWPLVELSVSRIRAKLTKIGLNTVLVNVCHWSLIFYAIYTEEVVKLFKVPFHAQPDGSKRSASVFVAMKIFQHAEIIISLIVGLGHTMNFEIENRRSKLWPTFVHDKLLG